MNTESFRAMGTTVTVTLDSHMSVGRVRNLFDHIEQTCSRFLDHSELSRVNHSPAPTVDVSPLLADVLAVASRAVLPLGVPRREVAEVGLPTGGVGGGTGRHGLGARRALQRQA